MIERLKHEERITRRSFLSHALIIAGAFGIGAVGGIVVATPDRERVRELEMEVAELKTRGGQQQVVYGQGVDEEARREIADIWRVLKEVETQQKDVNELRFKVDNIILENSGGSYIPDGVR